MEKVKFYNLDVKLNGKSFQEWQDAHDIAHKKYKKLKNIYKYTDLISFLALIVGVLCFNFGLIAFIALGAVIAFCSYMQTKYEFHIIHNAILITHIENMFHLEYLSQNEDYLGIFLAVEDSIDEMSSEISYQLGIEGKL